MNSDQQLQSLVNQLATDGHQEIVVMKLPSQVKRRRQSLFAPRNRKQLRAKTSA